MRVSDWRRDRERVSTRIATDVLKGAVAGAGATWAMNQVTTKLYELEDNVARSAEARARRGGSADASAAQAAARMIGHELSKENAQAVGTALHWSIGIAAGAAYAVLRRRYPSIVFAKGLSFGLAVFAVADELMNPALGFTPGPLAFPWQAHARGLAGHAAFGMTTEALLEALG